jgi:succinate dehydrogenase / fumarate reductase, flavoprotein subunit
MAPRIVVVGGGLAGLMTTIKIAEAGFDVDLISLVPVKRSHSVCAQGGINGAVNTKGEGDSPWEHFDDSIYGGDFLADQPLVKAMCEAAPSIIYMFDRMGVPFNRTPEGLIDFRRFGGTKHHRTAYAGATTGQQLLYALDEQVRRHEAAGKVVKYEGWDFTGLVLHEGRVAGCTAQNLHTMEFKAFKTDAVIMATGGIGLVFGRSTNSVICTGSAAAIIYEQGCKYANGEFIQVHPTSIPGDDKLRLMSESIRGEGGRVWTYKDGKPWYFLEEWYPAYGNLVPRDIATRAIFKVCVEMGLGVDGKNQVYLDISHIPRDVAWRKLGGVLEIYEKFIGDDPTKVPMRIFPGMHYTMGGIWVGFDMKSNGDLDPSSPKTHMTNIPGLYAVGECEHQYHGANRLGANSLVSCVFEGMITGPAAVKYVRNLQGTHADGLPSSVFEQALKRDQEKYEQILRMDGPENPYVIGDELGKWMTDNVTVVRYNARLQETLEKIKELKERFQRVGVPDTGAYSNQPAVFTRWLWGMLELGEITTLGALLRDESRGAHYKPEFPERNDEKYLKTTIAEYTPDGPKISYEEVVVTHIKPRVRKYDTDKKTAS